MAAPFPEDEAARLEALRALDVLDTPSEERFDRITRMAARVLGLPIVVVSLVDAERLWLKSSVGLEATELPRPGSFSAQAILQDGLFVVPDTTLDRRFADLPDVVGGPRIRFYAGQPLRAPSGHRVGTLCVLGQSPHELTEGEQATLADLAVWAELELGARELQRAVAAEQATESRLMSVLDSVADGVATFDINGAITSVNHAARALFRMTAEQMDGMSVSDIVVPEDRAIVFEALAERASSDVGELFRGDLHGLRGDGTSFPMEVTVSEVAGHEGQLFLAIGRDLSERRRAAEVVAGLQERTDRILSSVGDAIVGLDRAGLVVFANHAACETLLCAVDEMIGLPFHDHFHHSRADGTPYPWDECSVHATLVGGSALREYDAVFWRADGSSFAAEFVSTPLADGDVVTGAVVAFRDVTERRAVERMKDEFVSVLSHELRTPLTSIRGSLGLVAGRVYGPLPEEAQAMLDVAVGNTDRLVRLVNDILDFERLRHGQISLDRQPVDLTALARQAVASLGRSHDVEVVVVGGPVEVLADADRVVQVVTNLVGNAVKFSDAGGTVEVASEVVGEEAVLRVRDHGRGIPAELLESIFDRFQQVDASDAREKGGTGLGLAIARGIVEQHGGRIWAESTEGAGATFSVALPRG